jgi:serine/threonine protein kinase
MWADVLSLMGQLLGQFSSVSATNSGYRDGMQVASYMRAVLRTIMQCHSHHILHRDIKPGNFMLLENKQHSPLKAIGTFAPTLEFLAQPFLFLS